MKKMKKYEIEKPISIDDVSRRKVTRYYMVAELIWASMMVCMVLASWLDLGLNLMIGFVIIAGMMRFAHHWNRNRILIP